MDINFTDYIRFFLALVFVLGLIAALTIAGRRLGFGFQGQQPRGVSRRLAISESLLIDGKHRLVLIRRDGTEHLILLGAGPDLLVERGIVPQNIAAGATASHFNGENIPASPAEGGRT
jgi:flagellar protein FliO/FliZ